MRWTNKPFVAREDEVPPPTPHEMTISGVDPFDSIYRYPPTYPAPPRGRMNRFTSQFLSNGRTPSLFFHNYRPPQPMNDSLYDLYSAANDSDYFHHAQPSSPVKPAYDHEKLKNEIKNELKNEQKIEQERKKEAELAMPAAVACAHQNCGKDRAMLEEKQQYNYGDTQNSMQKHGDDESTVVVPMFSTKQEEMEKQAMHRGRIHQMLERQPNNWFPLFSYLSALGMAAALVATIIQNRQMTGSVIDISPFNVMLGPSTQTLVQAGARYSPCMRSTDLTKFECANTNDQGGVSPPSMILSIGTGDCSIHDTCGLTSFGDDPNQAYRVITAIFVHSGILHYFFNMTIQLGLGRRVERRLNPLRYGLTWLVSGIIGNIFSTTFSPVSSATMGCSGSLFGVISLLLIDLLRSWRLIADPGWQLIKLITLFALGLAYGYLPGPDNFAHIGGFVAGLLVGLVTMPSNKLIQTRGQMIFKWIVRAISTVLLGVTCYLLLNTFYKGQKPEELFSWCKYLACLPINDMCSIYNVS